MFKTTFYNKCKRKKIQEDTIPINKIYQIQETFPCIWYF